MGSSPLAELARSNNGGAEEGSRRAAMGVQGSSDVTLLNRAAALRVARRDGQEHESNFLMNAGRIGPVSPEERLPRWLPELPAAAALPPAGI